MSSSTSSPEDPQTISQYTNQDALRDASAGMPFNSKALAPRGPGSGVRLISISPGAEGLIIYCARASNPNNQDNPEIEKLLNSCLKQKHWSPFDMANMVLEIVTTRAISAQIIRHRSAYFQEFSQRYAKVPEILDVTPRRQDIKNRQNSIDDLPDDVKEWWQQQARQLNEISMNLYQEALQKGIAKECARFMLPMASKTVTYMNGTIRTWIHYIELRTGNGTQLEHMIIANQAKEIFKQQLPIISKALGWL